MQRLLRKPSEATPARMQRLATLPVFLDLAGRRAVVIGGSAAAAWKAELIAAAGAQVEIYAPDPGAEMVGLVAHCGADGCMILHRREWCAGDLTDAAIAIADVESDAEAELLGQAGARAGVLLNVIDKPEHCRFQLGSIVNRSPIVIGISTHGAAPILAQAIRRRIEALLPASLAAWGTLARELRGHVMERLTKGAPRRMFWERFAEAAFRRAPGEDEITRMARAIDDLGSGVDHREGRVTLVGAGPGDADLLTLKAVRALQSADVILFDDLVSADVLELARREARRVRVGKRGARASCAQDDINALMLELAREGRHVVRLKSGDPMIFGRAGEEIATLREAGIKVEIVPGVTSALAAAAALGVSLTHRDLAHSVRFIAGHGARGMLPEDLDWPGLADPTTTLMFYMGGRNAAQIAANLMANGLSGSTPVAIMCALSRPEEKLSTCTLCELAAGSVAIDREAPVLIGVGRVFHRAEHPAEADAVARPRQAMPAHA